MKTRAAVILLVIALVFSLSACKDKNTASNNKALPSSSQAISSSSQPAKTSAGTPINYEFSLDRVDMIDTPDSTCFSRIGYDSYNEVLVVTFRDSGATYAYYDVPDDVWGTLESARSMGGYYNSDIKGNYYCEKLG